jgi:hypothetical protein
MRRSRRVRGRVSLTNGKRLLGKLISLFQKLNNLGMRSQMLRRWECNRVCASIVLERPKIAAKLTSSFPSLGQRNHSVGLLSRPARRGCKRKIRSYGAQPESNCLKAHALCQFPDGPLIEDFTFTRKTNGTIDFVNRDGTYTAILYRCSNRRTRPAMQ